MVIGREQLSCIPMNAPSDYLQHSISNLYSPHERAIESANEEEK